MSTDSRVTPEHAFPALLTIEQTAEHLQVSTKTIRRWIDAGDLVAHRLVADQQSGPSSLCPHATGSMSSGVHLCPIMSIIREVIMMIKHNRWRRVI